MFALITILTSFICIVPNNVLARSKADTRRIEKLENHLKAMTEQVMLQQFYSEQRIRSEGQSGISLQRLRNGGTKNYFTETHTGKAAAAVHNHANNIRTVGMGEFSAVLNGVAFTTRHNDYRLFMPHRTSKEYHATEPIPFPGVPDAVKEKRTVQEQVDEMRQWFKAWRDQDHSVRDYRKYFKPILCYLEGAWTKANGKIDEPFASDRHFIDAKSWMELHRKLMFTSYSGSKSIRENFSFLPTKIIDILNNTVPIFAQWNYRILCHPLKKDLPLDRLRVVEDLSSRMMTKKDIYKHKHSRAARFQLNSQDKSKFFDRPTYYEFLDDIMAEIPGKDNYQGKLFDEGLEMTSLNKDGTKKDVSRYHRWFTSPARDAMGTSRIHRGYNDHMMFAAMTTQNKTEGIRAKKCEKIKGQRKKKCKYINQRWTYAIPLEIIYLTPISSWNPYNLAYHGAYKRWDKKNPTKANNRNGACTEGLNQEFNGTSSKLYFITPNEFYTGGQVGRTSADTSRGTVCVLDKEMKSRKVRAAGTHVFLPYIKNVGVLRQRYPIFPVHGEGSSVWKEVSALREIVMDMEKWKHMVWNYQTIKPSNTLNSTTFEMQVSRNNKVSQHTHEIELSASEMEQCKGGQIIYKMTSTARGHEHNLRIRCRDDRIIYIKCGDKNLCWDRHGRKLLKKLQH